jgi:hypothetical protein
MSTMNALNGIIVAAEHYVDDTQLHEAVRIHAASLDTNALINLIEGLSGFAAAALRDTPAPTLSGSDARVARLEAVELARAVLGNGEQFAECLTATQSDPKLLVAASAQLLAYVARCVPGLTAAQVLDASSAAIVPENEQ